MQEHTQAQYATRTKIHVKDNWRKEGVRKKNTGKKTHFFCKKQKIFGAMFDPHKSTRDDKKD